MHPVPNLVLIGFTGCGKTTVGAALAARLGRPHLDVDAALEAEVGPIPAYVAGRGVTAFREAEERVVRRLVPPGGAVVSSGAGTVRRLRTRRALLRNARVFFLDAPAEVLAARLGALAPRALHRPDLAGAAARSRLEGELAERRPLYLALGERIDAAAPVATVVETLLARVAGGAS